MIKYQISFSLNSSSEDIEDGVYDEMDEMDDDILEEGGDEDY